MTDITRPQPVHWVASGASHPGAVRPHNEDAIFVCDEQQLWLVADGMGGHSRGDLASQSIIQALAEATAAPAAVDGATRPTPMPLSDKVTQLESALIAANQTVCDYSVNHLQGAVMGSTLAGLILQDHLGFACWAGDSRVYRLRDGKLQCLTRDHSRLQELLDRGVLQPDAVADHPEANIITRALGAEPFLQLDMTLFSAYIGDRFLLCTDGLYNALSETQLAELLLLADHQQACEALIQQALKCQARDNVSAIVVAASRG